MKKKFFALLLTVSVIGLVGCGGVDDEKAKAKTSEKTAVEAKEETLMTAEPGDTVTGDWGAYKIEKVTTPNSEHKSGPITFDLQKVLLATFVPDEENTSLFDAKEIKIAITLIESENTSEDTVSFDPFGSKVTTNTKGQYEAQEGLNTGDSEHIGPVTQKFTTAYNLADESLSHIEQLTFVMDGTAKDATTIGDDVTVKVSFE